MRSRGSTSGTVLQAEQGVFLNGQAGRAAGVALELEELEGGGVFGVVAAEEVRLDWVY